MPPPPSTVSSFSGTLQQLAKEYDSVVLELFDTRKALQETRRELSQALYQNDAAIRVLARVSMERDAARQEAQQFQAAAAESSATTNGSGAPSKKKPRLDDTADLPLSNDIPSNDLDTMLAEWEKLHNARRAKPKSTYSLPDGWKTTSPKSWHKSTCRGLTAISQCGKFLVTAGKDKEIVVYDCEAQVVTASFSPKSVVVSLDAMPKEDDSGVLVVATCGDETMHLYDTTSPDVDSATNVGDKIVAVTGHPTGKHCCAMTKSGKVMIFRITDGDIKQIQQISTFSGSEDNEEYSSAAMHPDGLLILVGTAKGEVKFWDVKNKTLAGNLSVPNGNEDAVVSASFSSNGYHVASAHASGALRVWDLRKQKLLAEMNTSGDNLLQSVEALAFHPDGKYLAYGGKGGLHITMVKEWKISATLDAKNCSGVLWDEAGIASIGSSGRTVTFHSGAA